MTPQAAFVALFVTAAFALNTSASAQAPPGSLWYNGDFNGVGSHANGVDTSDPDSHVYDDFVLSSNATITGVFSDNLLNTVVTGAGWEIREGVSEGNEGTLVASGTSSSPTVTATGRSGFGYDEFMVEVTGLHVNLTAGVRYWLNVTPIGNGTGHSLNSMTSGTNCVGMPCGNNGNSWFLPDGPTFSPYDFSMGVIGPVPEPAPWAMMALGAVVLIGAQQLRRRKKA